MTRSRPRVTFFVPAYNAAATLGECLASIGRQTLRPHEVIVVDDGSSDATARIARRAGVTLIQHPGNRGVAATRNTAILAAQSGLVASLDSDQLAPRTWLARMVGNFEGRRRIVGCCGRVIERYTRTLADRWRAVHMRLSFGMRRSYSPRWLHGGSMLVRQAVLDVGLFDERCLSAYEDVDLVDRLRTEGHTLLYDPTLVVTHLKRSRPGDVVRGFWSYWAAKNEMQGSYASMATAARLMIERQMGIAAHRIGLDLRHRRDELLGLDLMVPLTFCIRDLEDMVRLKMLRPALSRTIQRSLAERFQAVCDELLRPSPSPAMASLAFAGGRPPGGRGSRLNLAAKRYVATFDKHFRRLLGSLTLTQRSRLTRCLPVLLAEAKLDDAHQIHRRASHRLCNARHTR